MDENMDKREALHSEPHPSDALHGGASALGGGGTSATTPAPIPLMCGAMLSDGPWSLFCESARGHRGKHRHDNVRWSDA